MICLPGTAAGQCLAPCMPSYRGAQQLTVPHAAQKLPWRSPETLDLLSCCCCCRTTLNSLQAGVALGRSRASRCWMGGTMQGRPARVQTTGPLMCLLSDLRVPCSYMVSMALPCSRHGLRCSPCLERLKVHGEALRLTHQSHPRADCDKQAADASMHTAASTLSAVPETCPAAV